jgi:hypothetical protein
LEKKKNTFVVDSRQWYFDRYQHYTHPFRTGAFKNHIFIIMSATGMPKKLQFGPSQKKDASLFLDCFRGATKHKEYWNKWAVDECWIDVINE